MEAMAAVGRVVGRATRWPTRCSTATTTSSTRRSRRRAHEVKAPCSSSRGGAILQRRHERRRGVEVVVRAGRRRGAHRGDQGARGGVRPAAPARALGGPGEGARALARRPAVRDADRRRQGRGDRARLQVHGLGVRHRRGDRHALARAVRRAHEVHLPRVRARNFLRRPASRARPRRPPPPALTALSRRRRAGSASKRRSSLTTLLSSNGTRR